MVKQQKCGEERVIGYFSTGNRGLLSDTLAIGVFRYETPPFLSLVTSHELVLGSPRYLGSFFSHPLSPPEQLQSGNLLTQKPLPFKPSNLLPLAKLFNLDVTSPRSVSTKPHFGPPRSFSDIFTGSNQIQSDYVLVRSPVSPSPSTVNPIPLREFFLPHPVQGILKQQTTSMSRYSQTNPSNMTPTTTTTVYPKPTTTKNIQTTPSTTPTTTTTIVFLQAHQHFSNIDSKAHISHSIRSTTPAVERRSSTPKRALSFITNPSTTRTTTVFLPTSTAAPIKRSFVTPSEIDIISSNYKPPRVEIKSAIINSQGIPLHAKVQLAESSTRDPPSHSSTSTTACTTTTVTTSTSNPSSTRTTTPLNSLAFVTPLLNEIKSYVTKSQKKYKKPFFVTPSSSTSTKSKSTPPNKYRQYTIRSSRVTAPFSLLRGRDNIRKEDVTTTRSSFQNRRRVRKLSSDSSTRTPRNNFSAYRSSDRKRPKSYYRRFKVRNTPSTTTNSFTVRRTRVNSRYPSSTNDSFTNNTHDDIDRIFHEIDPKVKNFILKPFDILTKPIKNVVDTFILKKKKKKWPKYIGVSHSSTFSPSPIDSALMSSTTLRPSVNVLPSYVSTPLNSFEQLIPSHSHIPDLVEIPPSSQVELPSYSSSTTTTTTKNPFLRTPKPSRKPKYEYNPSSSFTTTTKKPTIKKPIKAFINLGSNHAKQPSFHENRPTEFKPSSNIKQNKDNFVYLHYPVTQVPTYYSSEASYTINPKTRKPYVTISRDPVLLFTTKPTTIPSSTSFISNGHGHYLIPSTTHTPVTPLINVNPNAVTVGTYGKPQKNFNRNDHSVDNVVKRPSSILSDEYGVPEAPMITDFQPLNENGDFLLNYKSIQRNKPDIVPVSLGDEYGIPEAPLVTNIEPIQQGGSFFTNYRPIQRNKPKESLVSLGADEYGVPEAPLVTNIETIEQKGFFSTNYRPIQRDKPKKPLISLDTNKICCPRSTSVKVVQQTQPSTSYINPITTNYSTLPKTQKVIPDQLPTLNNDYSPLPSEKDSPEQVHSQPLPSLDSYNPPIKPQKYGNQYHSPDQFNKVSTINPHLLPSLDYTPSNNLFDKEPSNPGPSEGYRPPSNNNHNQIQSPVVPNKAQLPKLPYQSSILEYQPPNPSKKLDKPLNPKDFKTSSKDNRGHDNNASSVSYSPPNPDLKSIHQYKSKKTSYSTTPKSINPSFDQSTYNKDVHRTDPQSDIDRPQDHNYSKKNLSPDKNSKNYSINHRDPLNNAPISEERLIPKYSSNGSSLETQENKYYEHNAGSNEFNESSTSRSTKVFHKYNSKHHLMDDKIPNIALGEEYRPASMTEHRSTSLKPKFNENGGRIHYHRRKNKPKGKRPYASKNGNRTPKQQHYSNNRSLSKEQQERQSLSSHGRNGQYQQKATTQTPKQLPQTRYPTRYPKYTTANSHVTKSYVRPISNIRSTTSSLVKSLNSSPNYKKPTSPPKTYVRSPKPPIIYPSKTYKDKSILKSLPPRTQTSDIDYDSEDVYFDYYYDDARDLNLNIQKSTPIHIVRRPSPRPPNYAISKRPTPKSVLVVNKPNYSSPSYQAPPPSQYQRAKPSFPNKKLNYHPHKAFSSSSEVLPELHGLLRPDNWDVKDFQGWEAYFSKGYDPKNAPRFPPGERTTMTESSNNFHGIGIGFNDWIKESEVESFGEGFPEHGEFSDIFGRDFAAKRMDSSETSFVPRTGLYYSKFEVSPQDQEVLEPFVQKVYNKDHQTHLLKELLNPLQEAVLQLSLN
ncbi:unnamed protein product [Lepeophtheirus salmonis]|uniref:(salmon louse) hypothetical protein n=1 Tax=Lepeophtheirus salmonis TaxID=72036 RepID=A0A7R8GZY8_LEPSM|nr:unnamed protein product [Lepeophtheirus salmonis]CAF2773876.1 unnamed protein product [Lepeophtheirus salmonis]